MTVWDLVISAHPFVPRGLAQLCRRHQRQPRHTHLWQRSQLELTLNAQKCLYLHVCRIRALRTRFSGRANSSRIHPIHYGHLQQAGTYELRTLVRRENEWRFSTQHARIHQTPERSSDLKIHSTVANIGRLALRKVATTNVANPDTGYASTPLRR